MMGAPSSAIQLAVLNAAISGGRAHQHVRVDQRRQQTQQADQHGRGGEQRLREEEVGEHREEAQEEDHEGIAAGAQFQGLEASSTTISVTPASRPSKVRWVDSVAPSVTASRPSSHHLPGQRPRRERQPAAPDQHARRQQAAPHRQIADLGHA